MGCNMSLRRTVLAAVGGFDTGLGRHGDNQLGCEETELCIRAGQLFPDGVFLHEPAAVVHHHVPGQRASWRYFRDRCRAEGISKAGVARRVGRSAALASEAGYVRRVLPTGVLTNLGRSLHGDLAGVARAGAIVAGLGLTATGFLSARWAPRRRSARIRPRLIDGTAARRAGAAAGDRPRCSAAGDRSRGAATSLRTSAPSAW